MTALDTLFSQRDREGLSKESPTPLYYQLYTLLRGMILDGTLPFGERMPTEEQLAETFGVSRITAKRAMDEIAAEELVERRRGKGTHVTYRYTPKPVKAPLVGMLQEIESMARNTRANVLDCDMRQPPGEIREELELDAGVLLSFGAVVLGAFGDSPCGEGFECEGGALAYGACGFGVVGDCWICG